MKIATVGSWRQSGAWIDFWASGLKDKMVAAGLPRELTEAKGMVYWYNYYLDDPSWTPFVFDSMLTLFAAVSDLLNEGANVSDASLVGGEALL